MFKIIEKKILNKIVLVIGAKIFIFFDLYWKSPYKLPNQENLSPKIYIDIPKAIRINPEKIIILPIDSTLV